MFKCCLFIISLLAIIVSCNPKKSETAEFQEVSANESEENIEPSPNTFIIKGFSDEYYGKLYVEDQNEVFTPGWIAIYRKSDNKELIKVESEELAFSLHEGEVKANIQELPYGEQSIIIYDDFNFDGIKDFAIMDGQESCYHGPSFAIYLGNKKNDFDHDGEFSRLAHEYCGMFNYDPEEKMISVMTKSGCCWHQFSQFAVENNIPVEILTTIIDNFNPPYEIETTKERKNGKMVESTTKSIDVTEIDTLLTFTLENNKEVFVFPLNSSILNYVLLKEDGAIDFDYFYDVKDENHQPFKLETTSQGKNLTFVNRNITYKIYESKNDIGIEVDMNGKIYDLKGKLPTKQGSLSKIKASEFENVNP